MKKQEQDSRFPGRKKEAEIMDFSQESNLEEKLLGQLRSAFWGKFEDDDLASVHAAGKPPVYRDDRLPKQTEETDKR